jgi:hypothetical protein
MQSPITQQDIVYCDAALFMAPHNMAILGIVYKNEVTRIRARAKNTSIAELLAILMAKKLYPGKLVVNDCKAVTDMFTQGRVHSLQHMLGQNGQAQFLMESVNLHGVLWQRRRTDEMTCLVDSATRRTCTENYKYRLRRLGFTLREYGF